MNILKNKIVLIIATLCLATSLNYAATPGEFIRNYNLPVLYKDDYRPIYQIRSEMDLGGWTCGFFTLKNARDLECFMGLNKPCDIKQECNNYIQSKGINPHGALTNGQLINLADEAVRVRNFHALHINNHGTVGLIPEQISWNVMKASNIPTISTIVSADRHAVNVTIQAPYHTTQEQINTTVEKAVGNELYEKLINLNNSLHQYENGVLNFGCILEKEKHVILVSVIQLDGAHRAIFVYDNLNQLYLSTPARNLFVDTLYNIFCA